MKVTRRIITLLLAGALLLPSSVAAAEEPESESSAVSEVTESSSQTEVPEEETGSAVEQDEESSSVPEESGEEEKSAPAEELEQETTLFAASSVLVTGGHKTYMSGYKGGYFKPNEAMTRAEVAQMLYNLLAAKPPVTESSFSDVSLNSWYGIPVNALYQKGVLSGYKDGTFLPNEPITRAEFVAAVTKCFTLAETTGTNFSDVPSTYWAAPFIAAATAQGWISGMGNGKFEPRRNITRAEATAVMNAALGRKNDGFAADRETQKFKDVPKTHWGYEHITEAASPLDETTPENPDTALAVGKTVRVTSSSGLNLRTEPNTDSEVIVTLPTDDLLTVVEVTNDSWILVTTSTGQSGYVYSAYVQVYVPGQVSGAALSASSLSLHRYQSIRLDGSVQTGSVSEMMWKSSNPEVAVVGYDVPYGSSQTKGAIVYGKSPGTATITFYDRNNRTSATCTVTVTAAEGVRYGYSSENSPSAGDSFDLVAVTESSKTSVTFRVSGPADDTYTASSYTEESSDSSYGLPQNRVRVFKKSVTFSQPGTYTVTAQANGSSDSCTFTVLVSSVPATTATTDRHRTSTEMLRCIAHYEGTVREIQDDDLANGNPTVGYGNVISKNEAFYNNLTDSELWAMLVEKVNDGGYSGAVNSYCSRENIKLAQQQFDAMVSFVYNLGTGTLTTGYGYMRALMNATEPPKNLSKTNPISGKLTVQTAYLRETATPGGDVIMSIPIDKTVSVIDVTTYEDTKQIWYQVQYNGKTGWMPAGYIQLSAASCDWTYADPTVVANQMLQWCTASGSVAAGLVYRRQAECKVFFFGDYEQAYHYNDSIGKYNTYQFIFPDVCKGFG